jgi:hypothetical protein
MDWSGRECNLALVRQQNQVSTSVTPRSCPCRHIDTPLSPSHVLEMPAISGFCASSLVSGSVILNWRHRVAGAVSSPRLIAHVKPATIRMSTQATRRSPPWARGRWTMSNEQLLNKEIIPYTTSFERRMLVAREDPASPGSLTDYDAVRQRVTIMQSH